MNFTPIRTSDLVEIKNLQPNGWSDIINDISFYIESEFCHPIKTSMDGKIVGIGATLIFKDTAWLAHIIVDSNYRKLGLGLALVNELIQINEDNDIKNSFLIATNLGLSVYQKAGFEIISPYTNLKRETDFIDNEEVKNVIPYQPKHYRSLMQLDQDVSGENREVLIKEFLQDAKIYLKGEKLLAYYLPALGDGTIIASSFESGKELMKLKYKEASKAIFPIQNHLAIDYLLANGYVLNESTATRMRRGTNVNWNPECIFARIGGNFG